MIDSPDVLGTVTFLQPVDFLPQFFDPFVLFGHAFVVQSQQSLLNSDSFSSHIQVNARCIFHMLGDGRAKATIITATIIERTGHFLFRTVALQMLFQLE